MRQPKYKIGQTVNVQIFNIIATGEVEQISIRDTLFKDGTKSEDVKYWVKTRCGNDMEPWEEDLDFVQNLPLGEME